MNAIWKRITNIGIQSELTFQEKSRVRITNQMTTIVALVSILYLGYDLLFGTTDRTENQLISFYVLSLTSFFAVIPVFLLNYSGNFNAARIAGILCYTIVIAINSILLSKPFHSELYFFTAAAYVFIVFQEMRWIIPMYLLQMIGFGVAVYFILIGTQSTTELNVGLYIRILLSFGLIFAALLFLNKETNAYQEEIEIKNIQLSSDHDEIQKMNYTKDKIFSIISHDLRSPIGSLQAVLGLLQREELSEHDFKRATSGLEKQVDQLRHSLDELLTWSKSQLHGINPEPTSLPLKQLVSEVVNVHRLAARNKRIIVTTNISNDLVVYCDLNMLKSVITNLLTNAIKFTPFGGAISISAKKEKVSILIMVEDTGVGIPTENLEKIFSPITHFTTRGTNNEKGTGLGLIMCRDFVLKNNGNFEVESEDGKGSRFIITLPAPEPVK